MSDGKREFLYDLAREQALYVGKILSGDKFDWIKDNPVRKERLGESAKEDDPRGKEAFALLGKYFETMSGVHNGGVS